MMERLRDQQNPGKILWLDKIPPPPMAAHIIEQAGNKNEKSNEAVESNETTIKDPKEQDARSVEDVKLDAKNLFLAKDYRSSSQCYTQAIKLLDLQSQSGERLLSPLLCNASAACLKLSDSVPSGLMDKVNHASFALLLGLTTLAINPANGKALSRVDTAIKILRKEGDLPVIEGDPMGYTKNEIVGMAFSICFEFILLLQEQSIPPFSDDSVVLRKQGNAFFASGHFEASMDSYLSSIFTFSRTHGLSTLLSNRSITELKLGNDVEVLMDATAALVLDMHNVKAHFHLGSALKNLGLVDQAKNLLSRGISVCPSAKPLKELLKKIDTQPMNQPTPDALCDGKKIKGNGKEPYPPVLSICDRILCSGLSNLTLMSMSGPSELLKKQSTSSLEWAFNNSIKISKFTSFYEILRSTVSQQLGPQADLNWRWFDPNLFVSELKLHDFGTIDWYNDVDSNNQNTMLNLEIIKTIYSNLGSVEKIDILKKSVVDPIDTLLARSKNNNGMDAEEAGDLRKAEVEYNDALALDPHCLVALYNIADLLCRTKQYGKAKKSLNKLLLLDPENAKAWGLSAMCYEGIRMNEKAIESYEKARLIDNTSGTRLRNFAILMVETKNYDRAKLLYEELIELDPQNGDAIAEYADLLHSMGLISEALTAFEKALDTGNVNGTGVNDYAVLLFKIAKQNGDPAMLQKAKHLLAIIPDATFPVMFNRMFFDFDFT